MSPSQKQRARTIVSVMTLALASGGAGAVPVAHSAQRPLETRFLLDSARHQTTDSLILDQLRTANARLAEVCKSTRAGCR